MGFNLGAFAGGLAQGGMQAYKLAKDQESKDRELAMREEELGWKRQEQAKLAAIDQAASDTQGKVGGYDYTQGLQQTTGIGPAQARALAVNTGAGGDDFDRAVAESDQGVLRENAQRQGAALPEQTAMLGNKYTQQQADEDYISRVRGISRKAAREEETGELGLAAAKRRNRYEVNQEHALGFSQNVLDDLAASGGDVGAVLEKHFIPLYNENKLPGLNDGGTAQVVPNAMGGGKTVVITDKGGKQTTMPANMETLQSLTGKAQELMMASSSPENYWKNKEHYLNERKTAATEKVADTNARELEAKKPLYAAQADEAHGKAAFYTGGGAASKPTTKLITIDGGKDANGQPLPKQAISVVTTVKNNVPTVQAYNALTGQPVTDKNVLARAADAVSEGGGGVPQPQADSRWALMRKSVLDNKDLDAGQKFAELSKIDMLEKANLPAPGATLNPGVGKTSPPPGAPKATALPAQRSPEETAFDRETRELESGKRADYSPAVKSYLATLQAQRKQGEDEYTAQERRRALEMSRALAGGARRAQVE